MGVIVTAVYGLEGGDINAGRQVVESALGIKMVLETRNVPPLYGGSLYYHWIGRVSLALWWNKPDNLLEPDHPDIPVLLIVTEQADPPTVLDRIDASLRAVPGVRLLHRSIWRSH